MKDRRLVTFLTKPSYCLRAGEPGLEMNKYLTCIYSFRVDGEARSFPELNLKVRKRRQTLTLGNKDAA